MDFAFWQAPKWGRLRGSTASRGPCHASVQISRPSTRPACVDVNFYCLGGRVLPLNPTNGQFYESINPALIKSINPSTLWHFYARNPFAIDRSPINQRALWIFLFLCFAAVPQSTSAQANTQKKVHQPVSGERRKMLQSSNARKKSLF